MFECKSVKRKGARVSSRKIEESCVGFCDVERLEERRLWEKH